MRMPSVPRRAALMLATAPMLAAADACSAAPLPVKSRTKNVRDFGAKGDGVTDDTEAFNRATQADADWSWDLLCSIIVPAGRYVIAGSVYLRKGQSLIGEGLSTYIDASRAKRSTFIMGRRRNADRGVEDPGGLPVRIERLMGLGGAPDQGFIYATIPGFQINGLFLTAVGLGIEIEAADGIISDVEIDQCLTGVLLRKSQNIVLSNLNLYLANYGVTLAGDCRDIAIANSIFCYTKYAAVLLGDGAKAVTAVSVTNCVFTNNVPYETFEGYIYSRASNSDLLVTGCIFRNAPSFAVHQGAGVDLSLSLQGCIIDGMRTNPDYNQSLNSKGIRTGHGRFLVSNCVFRNLAAEAFRIDPGLMSLQVDGGSIERSKGDRVVVQDTAPGPISFRNMQGLANVATVGMEHQLSLPRLGSASHCNITIHSRDPSASVPVAQCLVVASQKGASARILWSGGQVAPSISVADRTSSGSDGGAIVVRLDARQFGSGAPTVDTIAHS